MPRPRKPRPAPQMEKDSTTRPRKGRVRTTPAASGASGPQQPATPVATSPGDQEAFTPRPVPDSLRALQERLREDGVELTLATIPQDHQFSEPIDLGFSLADDIIRMRRRS